MTWLYFICRVYVCLFLQHRLQFSGEIIEDGREKALYDVNTGQNYCLTKIYYWVQIHVLLILHNHLEVLMSLQTPLIST